jgi:protein-tyrosine-phosphatase/DNA-binding transcriptional ArsR family regulator
MIGSTNPPLEFLKLLGHDIRWKLLAALAESDRRVQELVELVKRPQNLISYHLRLLREGNLVRERRSSEDGRDVYYSLDLTQIVDLFKTSGRALHPALGMGDTIEKNAKGVSKRPYRILFLCTHNSARSQLAEGILRTQVGDEVKVYSAGSEPSGIHPLALKAAAALNINFEGHRSQHLEEFAGESFNLVITVCDKVREICPVFSDETNQIHWSLPDPASVTGNEEERYDAFLDTAQELSTRIRYLITLDRVGEGYTD